MKRIVVLFSILTSITMFVFAHAQTQYDYDFVGPKQNPYEIGQNNRCGPQGDGSYILCESTGGIINQTQRDFASFLREMYALAFILAGTVAFVRIVYGGILYSWSGVVDRKKEAIGIFKNVAIGMGLLMGSYAVLNTINPALTMLKLPTPVEGTARSSAPTTLGEGATPIRVLDKTIDAIRQENLNIINNLGLYTPAPDDTATINLINDQINIIGTPKNAAERARLTELQGALIKYESNKAEIDAAADAVTNTPPQQYKRTRTTQ